MYIILFQLKHANMLLCLKLAEASHTFQILLIKLEKSFDYYRKALRTIHYRGYFPTLDCKATSSRFMWFYYP